MSGCVVEGCDEDVHANNLCRRHYDMMRHTGSAFSERRARMCLVCGGWFQLDRSTRLFCSAACRKRYSRLKRRGKAPRRVVREPRIEPPPFKSSEPVVVDSFTDADVWRACKGVCVECGGRVELGGSPLDPDGVASAWFLPLEKGGRASLSNRVLLHVRCVDKWMERGVIGRNRKKSKRTRR